jgi:hypothetical protein
MIAGCILSENFVKSSEFSNHSDKKLIFPFGCDRGGDCTHMLPRLANRDNGNGASYCAVIASCEQAAELHANLQKTIYKEGSPHLDLVQALVLDKLHAVVVTSADAEGEVKVAEAAIVQLVEGPEASLGKLLQSIDVELIRKDDLVYEEGLLSRGKQDEHDERPKCIGLRENSDIALIIQFMMSGDRKKYAGFVLKRGQSVVFDFRFDDAMDMKDTLTFECYQLEGFPSHDTKHGWLVGGISTSASVSCNCLVCVQENFDYKHIPPEWIRKRYPNIQSFQRSTQPDEPMREGEYSSQEMWLAFQQGTANGKIKLKAAAQTKLNKRCKGITHKPLLYIPPSKDPMAPMHTPMGNGDHFRENVKRELRQTDELDGSWLRQVDVVFQDAMRIRDLDYKQAEAGQKRLHGLITRKETSISKKHEQGAQPVVIDRLKRELDELNQELERHAEESGLGQHCRLRTGAEKLISAIDGYNTAR